MAEKKLIAVCLSTLHDEDRFFFVKALDRYACKRGYRLLIFNSCSDLYEPGNLNNAGEAAVFSLLPYEKLSAVVIMSSFIFDRELLTELSENCRKFGVPAFSIDREVEGCRCFSFDYQNTFEQLCQHVIRDHGARDLRMIAGIEGNAYSEERVKAFRKALSDNGLAFDETMVGYGNFWEGPTLSLLYQWFEEENIGIPDAIICANDAMAITASTYLQRRGVKIPEECIITGFDGIVQAGYHIPKLTTCRQDYDTMGRALVESIEALENGGTAPDKLTVGFDMIRSQSCGCEPVHATNVNEVLNSLMERLRLSKNRQDLMCSVQSAISKMSDLRQLPSVLIDKFAFHTNVFALTRDVFQEPDFGADRRGRNAFSDTIDIVYHRYFWDQKEPCTVPVNQLFPDISLLTRREEPIVICSVHFLDMVMGYCIFQPEIDFDEYEKLHTLMSAIDASLGNFHGRIQIESINSRLVEVNSELKHLSDHDYMTGLMNRRGFYSELSRLILAKKSKDSLVVLISADLDGLKEINDGYGHLEGDSAITTTARALLSCSVQDEICARFGGDEFCVAAVISESLGRSYIKGFRERFDDYLARYNESSGKPYRVEASIGFYSEMLSDYFDIDRMIKNADERMYQHKSSRRRERK